MIGWVPSFQPKLGATFEGDGAALLHAAPALDELAESLGLPLLSSFVDPREPPPDFDGYPEELTLAIGPWMEWFSPTEGLVCVEGLLGGLDEPSVREQVPAVEAVLDDLVALRDVLLVAEKRKARFRLEHA